MFNALLGLISSSYVKWAGAVAVFFLPPDGYVLTLETTWFIFQGKIREFYKSRTNSSTEKPAHEKFSNTGETTREKSRSKPIPISGEGAPPSPSPLAADVPTTSPGGVDSTPSANATKGGQTPPPVACMSLGTAVTPTTAQIGNGAVIGVFVGVTVLAVSRAISTRLNNSMADTEK
jgi:hypothetical protein